MSDVPAAYRDLFELGAACQRVALEHRPVGSSPDGVFLEERLESLGDAAADVVERVTATG